MTVRYHTRGTRIVPDYLCQRQGVEHAEKICQQIPGAVIDEAIGELLLEVVTPLALEVTLAIQDELNARRAEVENLYRQQVERLRYEAELARRRYMRVDPDNRLVADELEADWNKKLREMVEAQEKYEKYCADKSRSPDNNEYAEIERIVTDFPRLWRDASLPDRERKRILRLILEDVTLIKKKQITVQVRFKGGATRTLILPIPLRSWEARQTDPRVVEETTGAPTQKVVFRIVLFSGQEKSISEIS
jgi:Arc/MetJ family transcription regulator